VAFEVMHVNYFTIWLRDVTPVQIWISSTRSIELGHSADRIWLKNKDLVFTRRSLLCNLCCCAAKVARWNPQETQILVFWTHLISRVTKSYYLFICILNQGHHY